VCCGFSFSTGRGSLVRLSPSSVQQKGFTVKRRDDPTIIAFYAGRMKPQNLQGSTNIGTFAVMCFIESFFDCLNCVSTLRGVRCNSSTSKVPREKKLTLSSLRNMFIQENDSRRRHLDAMERQVTTVYRNEESSVTNGTCKF
ncbi:hypothetical protein MKW98_021757, partial [Papaver atlanticum]